MGTGTGLSSQTCTKPVPLARVGGSPGCDLSQFVTATLPCIAMTTILENKREHLFSRFWTSPIHPSLWYRPLQHKGIRCTRCACEILFLIILLTSHHTNRTKGPARGVSCCLFFPTQQVDVLDSTPTCCVILPFFDVTGRCTPPRCVVLPFFNITGRCSPPHCIELPFFNATRGCTPPCCVVLLFFDTTERCKPSYCFVVSFFDTMGRLTPPCCIVIPFFNITGSLPIV
jgi:hypothetical protein